jgi:predicted  nucleic acid-binding Zn-ribbon protein
MDWTLIIATATFASTSIAYVWYLHKSLTLTRVNVNDLSNMYDKLERRVIILENRFEAMNSQMYNISTKLNVLRPEIDTAFVKQELGYAEQDLAHFSKAASDAKIKIKNLTSKLKSMQNG